MDEMSPQLPIAPPASKFTRRTKLLFAGGISGALLAIAVVAIWAIPGGPKAPGNPPQNNPTTGTLELQLRQHASGLKSPTAIAALQDAADKRLFVTEQDGTIRIVTGEGRIESTAFLDITSKVLAGGEMGLLGLAFHPKQSEHPYFFINYIDKQQNTIIARYSIAPQTGLADPGSEKVLLKIKQPYPNHNGGELVFGPDGYLYIGLGDGGSGGDPQNRGQNKNELLGKILRIDVDRGSPYAIPADNPFVNGGGKPEVWAYGLRNPWRLSFDRQTGDLYIADVGQNAYEEINFQAAASKGGQNYGWRCYEGLHSYNTDDCKAASDYVMPVIEHNHDQDRCSITGGYVYRGSLNPNMAGKYFYGDYCSGQVFYAQPGNWQPVLATDTDFSISTFGQDSSGELYLADINTGDIYRLAVAS